MAYKIRTYSKSQAQKLGVDIKPSKTKGKKIDVFKAGKKVASVGALGMNDYPTYKELEKKKKVKEGTTPMSSMQFANMASMASPSPTETSVKSLSDEKKQERLELLTYVKAHFDLVAVTLLVAYLGFSLYQMQKDKK